MVNFNWVIFDINKSSTWPNLGEKILAEIDYFRPHYFTGEIKSVISNGTHEAAFFLNTFASSVFAKEDREKCPIRLIKRWVYLPGDNNAN